MRCLYFIRLDGDDRGTDREMQERCAEHVRLRDLADLQLEAHREQQQQNPEVGDVVQRLDGIGRQIDPALTELDAETGREIWRRRTNWPWQPDGAWPGPRATPRGRR